MRKIAYIILGSNYNVHQELHMKFINECEEQGEELLIYSIDRNTPPEQSTPNASLHRIQMEINEQNFQELMDNILKRHEIDTVIVMDSIDFKGDFLKNSAQEEYQERYPFVEFHFIRFISPEYENPLFGEKRLEHFNFDAFDLPSIDELKPLIVDEKHQSILEKISKQIKSHCHEPEYSFISQVKYFTRTPGFARIFSDPNEAAKIILKAITEHVCQQIDTDLLGISQQQTFKPI